MYKKFFQEIIFEVSTALKFNSFPRKSINILKYASKLNGKTAMTTLIHKDDIAKSPMTMKTTTNTGKNKKKSVEKCEKKLSKPFKL